MARKVVCRPDFASAIARSITFAIHPRDSASNATLQLQRPAAAGSNYESL
jgi:hypothetical protein